MAEEPAGQCQLLRNLKVQLIDILSADADFVLQHTDSRGLLSIRDYQQVKACRNPSEKVRDLLDHVIQRGPEAAQGLLKLLKDQVMQETFPLLHFLNDIKADMTPSGALAMSRKRQTAPDIQETVSSKRICNNGSHLVTEKQLMDVARAVGRSWKEIGRGALNIPSVKLEHIEEDHSLHVERVFAMLRYWRSRQKDKATAAHLHFLLSQEDCELPPESIDFLLETG